MFTEQFQPFLRQSDINYSIIKINKIGYDFEAAFRTFGIGNCMDNIPIFHNINFLHTFGGFKCLKYFFKFHSFQ